MDPEKTVDNKEESQTDQKTKKDDEVVEGMEGDEIEGMTSEQNQGEKEGNRNTEKSENERKFDDMTIELNKPWPPLLAEFSGKARSYSDTSPRRAIVKAIKGDVSSCTSYMHFPHIVGEHKSISLLRGATSSPHLHQSFSRMHLPHINDPWNPEEDFPTVSVIALAEERDNTDDVIVDDEEDGDVRECFVMSDEENDDSESGEHAIYIWDRDMGRTRSLSEPPDIMLGREDVVEQRPRSMSMESVDKVKKPPSRLQFQMTLSELEEERGTETELESTREESDNEEERGAPILVLAESSEMITDSDHSEPPIIDSESSDEILNRWTRYEKSARKPSFSTDLKTIDENLRLPTDSRSRSAVSVLALVDEVTKDVMERTPTDSMIFGDGSYSEYDSEDSSYGISDPANIWKDKLYKRRSTLASTTPLREGAHDYATQVERDAFDKISKWKTDFASKLDDVLRKGFQPNTEYDKTRKVRKRSVDVPMNLSNDELINLKGNMISELRRKSDVGDVQYVLNHKDPNVLKNKCVNEIKRLSHPELYQDQEIDSSKLLRKLHDFQLGTQTLADDREIPSGVTRFDNIGMSKDKIAELLRWHDKEREHLLQELKRVHALEDTAPSTSSSKSSQVVLDSASLEKVFLSLQVIMDSIFKETISRLKGTIKTETGDRHREVEEASEKAATERDKPRVTIVEKPDKHTKKTSQKPSRIPIPVGKLKRTTKPTESKNLANESTTAVDNKVSSTNHVPNHVHTVSLIDHICHQDTCAGAEEETDSSSNTSSSFCECDFDSSENSTTNSDKVASTEETSTSGGHSFKEKRRRHVHSKTSTDSSVASSSSINQVTSRETTTSNDKETGHSSSEEESAGELHIEESDACSEIADLLGVYQVYNVSTERENELPRPQAPEPMTYEEKDLRDKLKKQKAQLKDSKRKIREMKGKTKRNKEERRQLKLQQQDWRDEYTAKDQQISELKRQVERMSVLMEKYKRALEEKSTIIKQKDKQIMKLLHPNETDKSRGKSRDDRDMAKQLKRALDENVRLQLKLSKMDKNKAELSSYVGESKPVAGDGGVDENLRMGGIGRILADETVGESAQKLKAIIIEKEKLIKDLEIRQGKVFQELTEKICEVMAERDSVIEENSRLTPQTQELEKNNYSQAEQITQLKKLLQDAEMKYNEKTVTAAEMTMSFMKKKLQQYETREPTTSNHGEIDHNQVKLLKASLDAYQALAQRLTQQLTPSGQENDNFSSTVEYEKKLGHITRLAREDREDFESALSEAVNARDAEVVLHQATLVKLQETNQKLHDLNFVSDIALTGKTMEELQKKQQALQVENSELKKQVKEKERGRASILIEITELQAKLAQRDLEIQELRHQFEESERRLPKQDSPPATESQILSAKRSSKFSNYSLTTKKYDSVAQRYTRQWQEETELDQQELDELRGSTREKPNSTSRETEEVMKLRKDLKDIKHVLDEFIRCQSQHKTDVQDELYNVKALERQESLYKQMVETRERLYTEALKEKNNMIKTLTEAVNNKHGDVEMRALEKTIKTVIEGELTRKTNELKTCIDNIPNPGEPLPYGVIADALKMNESAVSRLEDCTEKTWNNIKEELSELKDFTFEMADAIEKDLYSSQEQFTEFVKCSTQDLIGCVRDESHVIRKSVLERVQAQQEYLSSVLQTQDGSRFDEFHKSLDMFSRRNASDFQQARRDVLLAAEAITNTADELHHIKTALVDKLSVNDLVNDTLTRRREMVQKQEEVKELRKTAHDAQEAAKTLQSMEHEYCEKAKTFETDLKMKELQLMELSTPVRKASFERGTVSSAESLGNRALQVSQEGDKLRDDMKHFVQRTSSSGEFQRSNKTEDDHRRSYPFLYQTPSSRDYDGLTLRERLQKRARARVIAGNAGTYDEPYSSTSTATTLAWSRDPPSSS